MHETQLILYDGAERMLRKMGLDPKSVDPTEIRKDYESMLSRKLQLEQTYNSAEKDVKSLQQKLTNVEQYVGRNTSITQLQNQKVPQLSEQEHKDNPTLPHAPYRT